MDYKKRLEELKTTLKYFEAQANATQGAIQLLQEIIAEEDADVAKALLDKYFFDKDYKPQSNTFY